MAEPEGHFREKRQHPRYEVEILVDVSTSGVFVSNHVTNLSKGGLFIRTDSALPIGTEVDLLLQLPGRGAIRAQGRVVWNFDMRKGTTHVVPGNGIRFTAIAEADRALLETYLGELARAARPGGQ